MNSSQSSVISALVVLALIYFGIQYATPDYGFWALLKQVLSGVIFLITSNYFLVQARFAVFVLSVFGYLLITKWSVLFYPVYGDAASGPWIEALWLYKHNFDYVALNAQPGFTTGGPKAYLFSLYPGFIAVLMNVFHNVKTLLFVNHFISFILAAIIVGLFRELLLSIISRERALLIGLFFLFLPVSQSQIEILNMEIWVLFFMMLSAVYLVKKNVGRALLLASLAALVKVYAMSANLAVLVVSLIIGIFLEKQRRLRILILGCVSFLFAIFIFKCESYFFPGLWKVSKIAVGSGIKDLSQSVYFWSLISSLIVFISLWFKERTREFLSKHYPFIVVASLASAWMVVFFNSSVIFPRYWFTVIPFCLFCLVWALERFGLIQKYLDKLILIGIVIVLVNSYGFFYPPIKGNLHSRLERSLEYRNELKLEMQLAKRLETAYADKLIAAPFTIAQILAFPQLGYVQRPLNVMIYEYQCRYEGIKNFEGIQALNPLQTVWVDIETTDLRERLKGVLDNYPVSVHDKILEKIEVGPQKLQIFMGGASVEKMRRMIELANHQHGG